MAPVNQPSQPNGNGFEFSAGGASAKASGSTTVNVLLASLIVISSFYGVWSINQQTLIINQEHLAIMAAMAALTRANENVFLGTLMTPEQKTNLPPLVSDRARALVERGAENITNKRSDQP
jgi:hypothetical protein